MQDPRGERVSRRYRLLICAAFGIPPGWYKGNAAEDGRETCGWLLGHFIDPAKGVRSSKAVEVKWGIHPAGEKRSEWTADDRRTTRCSWWE